jgi:hypothetical protein
MMWNKWVAFLLAEGFTGVLLVLIVMDIRFTWTGYMPVGRYAWHWLRGHPWLNLGFALVIGAMIGHFLAKP